MKQRSRQLRPKRTNRTKLLCGNCFTEKQRKKANKSSSEWLSGDSVRTNTNLRRHSAAAAAAILALKLWCWHENTHFCRSISDPIVYFVSRLKHITHHEFHNVSICWHFICQLMRHVTDSAPVLSHSLDDSANAKYLFLWAESTYQHRHECSRKQTHLLSTTVINVLNLVFFVFWSAFNCTGDQSHENKSILLIVRPFASILMISSDLNRR